MADGGKPDQFWYCVKHHRVETVDDLCPAKHRLGPYDSREAAAQALNDAKTDIGWGHQIRSYVLQPYQLVKDLRTGVESTSPGDVLDGDLDEFMEAALAQRVFGGDPVEVADID